MVIESLVDGKSWGDIAVDDIKVLDGVGLTDCKGEAPGSTSFVLNLLKVKCVI